MLFVGCIHEAYLWTDTSELIADDDLLLQTQVVAEEELLKADGKGDNQEAELLILDEFAVLCRDLYAFYPMLIRYVDNNRYNIHTYTQ